MAQCATTALAGAVPRPYVRCACGWFGGFGPVPGVVSLPFPPSRPACPALRVAGCPIRVSLTLARWYAIPRGLCVPRARSGCPSGSPRVPFACLCARAPAASAPPPWVVWRAHLARSRHWALVGPFHVVRAPPRVLPQSLAPSGVLGGGRSGRGSPLLGFRLWGWRKGVPGGGAFHFCEGRLGSGAPPPRTARPLGGLLRSATHVLCARACGCGGPTLSPRPARPVGAACRGGGGEPSPYLAWGCAPPVGWVRGVRVPAGGLRGGGAARAPCTPFVWPGGGCGAGGRSASFRPSAFPGQSTKRVSLALFWSCGAWPPIPLRFVLVRIHWARSVRRPGALARARLFPAVPVGAGGWGRGRGRAPALSRAGGGGTIRPASGVGGRGPRGLRASGGGGGGRGRAAAFLLPLWVAARGSLPWPASCRPRTPPLRARSVRVAGPPRGGGMRGGPWTAPPGPLRT